MRTRERQRAAASHAAAASNSFGRGPSVSQDRRLPRGADTTTDLLLDRLVEQELAGMRLAEELCGAASFEELFELYGATRFLYPAKLAVLASRLGIVEDTWKRLLEGNGRVFKVLLRRRAERGEIAPKNAICAWRYTTATWQAQHLVSRDRHEYAGTLAALVGLSDWLAAAPGCKSLRLTYRPENPGVQSLFQGVAESLGADRAALDILDYYLSPLEGLRPTLRSGAVSSFRIDAAAAPSLRAFYRTRMHPALLDSLSLEDPELAGLHTVYEAHGLARRRAIFAAVHQDRIVGSVVCNLASEGINFSFLENAVECLALSSELTPGMRAEVFGELMRAAADYYRENGRDYLVALLHPTHAGLAGRLLRLERQKRYAVLTAAQVGGEGFRPIRESFIDYYRRLFEVAATSPGAGA